MRVVLDTNTILSALLFKSGRLTWIREGWLARRFIPLCSAATSDELIRAIAYRKFGLSEEDIRVMVGSYIGFAEVVNILPDDVDSLPRCRDENDQMFLELAMCGNAETLVAGDADLLVLADQCQFVIETPAAFKKRFD